MAEDIKVHGVKMPVIVYDGQILDGRHRVALASVLRKPIVVNEFKGTEEQARDEVVSLNVARRHLTMAQRVLIVRELFLPQAKIEAEKRRNQAAGKPQGTKSVSAEVREQTENAKAAEIAAAIRDFLTKKLA